MLDTIRLVKYQNMPLALFKLTGNHSRLELGVCLCAPKAVTSATNECEALAFGVINTMQLAVPTPNKCKTLDCSVIYTSFYQPPNQL